jgi:integrase
LLGHVEAIRDSYRVGAISADDVERQLRRMTLGPVTLERAARSYMESGIAPNTRRSVATFLAGAGAPLAALDVEALGAPRLESWIKSARVRRLARSSALQSWRLLRAIVRHAASLGWISRVPWGAWRPRLPASGYGPGRLEREAARSAEELAELLDAAAMLDAERARAGLLPDVEPKIACAAYAGLRQGELAGLRWTDVDQVRARLRVERQGGRDRTKQGKRHELRVAPELLELLATYRTRLQAADLHAPSGPVFPSPGISSPGRPRPYSARADCLPRALVRACAERAQLPNPQRWSAQSLRDTFATLEALAHAGDLEAVRDRTRHASTASLLRYLRSRSREPAAPGFELPSRAARPKLDAAGS